ncbi:hypothetical protein [Streptomyces sp. NRRL S-350]|uniref:hypothetical protein n=1 Tax=Streptomyces sp. NRRL S-350 TaxID=1463902 RepID=UPI000B1717C3|nr:hypothetical protein [Streptomyces sp. NRRL S-350]
MSTVATKLGDPEVTNLTRRLDHSVPDGDFAPQTGVDTLTRRLEHLIPDDDFAPVGTEV